MNPSEDHQLLSAYVDERSERAFAALVERHVGLVYATARRQLGDHALAQEVTQNVFIHLARKPQSFRHESTLAGWLYKITLLQARQSIRSELRRKRREAIAVELGTVDGSRESGWESLVPLLDEALMSLREKDRLALVLRFLEDRPLRDVGQMLGVNEDAAQKRVAKALELLTRFFQRRGLAMPALTLSAPFWKDLAKAAPAGLAALVTRTALHQAAVAPLSALGILLTKLLTLTKIQTAAACVLLGAIPLGLQWNALARAQTDEARRVAELQSASIELNQAQSALAALSREKSAVEANLAALRRLPKKPAVAAAEPDSYPYSEASPFVRVSKSLIAQLTIPPGLLLNRPPAANDPKFPPVSESLQGVLQITSEEETQLMAGIAAAIHQYRLLEAQHMEPGDQIVNYRMMRIFNEQEGPVESVNFKLNPFPAERQAFWTGVTNMAQSVLGEERAKIFMQQADMPLHLLTERISTSATSNFTVSYLLKGPPGAAIYMLKATTASGGARGGGGAGGRGGGGGGGMAGGGSTPLEAAEDQYAPEIMKPILARWRAMITAGNFSAEGRQP